MKIIFLDVDGVLNRGPYNNTDKLFDVDCMTWLKKIVDETGAEIVVSSTWKLDSMALMKLQQELHRYGLSTRGMTPNLIRREDEINEYLKIHGHRVENYVILDDWDLKETFGDKCITTLETGRIGLDEQWANQAIKVLQSI